MLFDLELQSIFQNGRQIHPYIVNFTSQSALL